MTTLIPPPCGDDDPEDLIRSTDLASIQITEGTHRVCIGRPRITVWTDKWTGAVMRIDVQVDPEVK